MFSEAVFADAVEVGVAAFCEAPDHAAARSRLLAAGLDEWLVNRLVLFLPLAFTRSTSTAVTYSDTFLDGAVERSLAADRVFVAAQRRAERAVRHEVDRIAVRGGGEFAVINQALHDGSRLEDLEIGPPVLPVPLPPIEPGDGGVPSPRAAFAAMLTGHGYTGGDLRFDARVIPHPTPAPGFELAQLDFGVAHPALDKPWLTESVAAAGTTWREAIGRGIALFERGTLHVLVAGLIDRSAAADQVSWERLDHPSGAYDLCIGPLLTLFGQAPPPDGLLDKVRAALAATPLTRAAHGMRIFTCHVDGRLDTNEVLLDGEPWPAGEHAVATIPPPNPTGRHGHRLFLLLIPA